MNDDCLASKRTTGTWRLLEAALHLLVETPDHIYSKRNLVHALTHFQARTLP